MKRNDKNDKKPIDIDKKHRLDATFLGANV